MEGEELKSILESLLLAAGEPVSANKLAAACEEAPLAMVKGALDGLQKEYAGARRGIVIEQVAGGYQMRTALENAPYVRRLLATRQMRLSRPLLETLAIIAYRQPLTRAEIDELRGVDCGGVLETLLGRRLVRVAGRKAVAGRPLLYATTAEFLETFGLKNLKALPHIEGLEAADGQTPPEIVIGEADSSSSADVESLGVPGGAEEPAPNAPAELQTHDTGSEASAAPQDAPAEDASAHLATGHDAKPTSGAAELAESLAERGGGVPDDGGPRR